MKMNLQLFAGEQTNESYLVYNYSGLPSDYYLEVSDYYNTDISIPDLADLFDTIDGGITLQSSTIGEVLDTELEFSNLSSITFNDIATAQTIGIVKELIITDGTEIDRSNYQNTSSSVNASGLSLLQNNSHYALVVNEALNSYEIVPAYFINTYLVFNPSIVGNIVLLQAPPVTYKHLLKDGSKIQVDSAIRDGNGLRIDTNYEKKWTTLVDTGILSTTITPTDVSPTGSSVYTLKYDLSSILSASMKDILNNGANFIRIKIGRKDPNGIANKRDFDESIYPTIHKDSRGTITLYWTYSTGQIITTGIYKQSYCLLMDGSDYAIYFESNSKNFVPVLQYLKIEYK